MKKKVRIVKSHRVAKHRCPICFTIADAATGMNESADPPRPGSYSICCQCGAINIFETDMSLRVATQAEIDLLPSESRKIVEQYVANLKKQKNVGQAKTQPDDWLGQSRFR